MIEKTNAISAPVPGGSEARLAARTERATARACLSTQRRFLLCFCNKFINSGFITSSFLLEIVVLVLQTRFSQVCQAGMPTGSVLTPGPTRRHRSPICLKNECKYLQEANEEEVKRRLQKPITLPALYSRLLPNTSRNSKQMETRTHKQPQLLAALEMADLLFECSTLEDEGILSKRNCNTLAYSCRCSTRQGISSACLHAETFASQ